jgi:branched-chain amino acid transport system substrate-binding protein
MTNLGVDQSRLAAWLRRSGLVWPLAAVTLLGVMGMAQAQKVVRIGVLGPLTGDLAYAGQFQLRGAQLHAAEINSQQKDVQIDIIAEDDESKCDRSVSAARKLISRDQIHALLGAWQSTCTLAIVPITKQAQIPQYTTSVATPITQQGSEWIFRVALQTGKLNRATLDYVVKTLGRKRVAILSSSEEVGKSFSTTSHGVLKDLGLQAVATEEYARGDKDFSGQLGRIRASNPDALIFATGFQEQAIIARQVRELGLNVQLLGGDTIFGNPKFVELAGRDIEGAILATVFIPSEDNPVIGKFVKAYRERFKEAPDPWAGQFYDAVGIIYEAVKANRNEPDARKIGDYTRSLASPEKSYSGLLGRVYFDQHGDGSWPPAIAQIVSSSPAGWKLLNR